MFALLGGLVLDLCVVLVMVTALGRLGRGVRVARGLLLILLGLSAVNLGVLAALNAPADLLMLTYLGDPLTARHIESPVDVGPSLGRLLVAVVLGYLGLRRAGLPSRPPLAQALLRLGALPVLLFTADHLAAADHRARPVAYADGASWLFFQLWSRPFALPPGADLRAALLTPAAHQGERFLDDPRWPLRRGTPHALCAAGLLPLVECSRDDDVDGHPLTTDCDDTDAGVHPGALDAPADGVDQDCSGLDAAAPDILLLQLEGLPARVLRATGGEEDVARHLAALARRPDARLFTRYETAGVQTSPGFVSVLCSLLPSFGPSITRAYPQLRVRCLPQVLAERGYATHMVQNGEPGFDRQGDFARHAGIAVVEGLEELARATGETRRWTKWGLPDEALFRHLAALLARRSAHEPPLFLVAQSITNHHPYVVDDARFPPPRSGATIWEKVRHTSSYVDAALGELVVALDELAGKPGRRPLLVIIAGDHGHATGLHPGNVLPASHLFAENVHTPLVWWTPGRPAALARIDASREAPASSVDVMPTVLGLLGVQALHASQGRDLGVPAAERDRRAISLNPMGGGLVRVRRGDLTVVTRAVPPETWLFEQGDVHEQLDVSDRHPEASRRLAEEAILAVMAARELVQTDRIWRDPRTGATP